MRPSHTGPLALTERQLATALGALAEAVTVQAADGRRRFANAAALELLGFATLEDYLAAAPNAIAARFRRFHEDGSPMDVEELPGRRVLRGERPGPLRYRWVDVEADVLRWLRMRSTPLLDDEGALAGTINVIEDVTADTDAALAWQMLDAYGRGLASSLDYAETLRNVAELAVPTLADWCAVDVLDARGELVLAALAHPDPERVELARELRRRYPADVTRGPAMAAVLRDATTSLVRGITDAQLVAAARDAEHLALLRELRLREVLVVPLLAGSTTVGALTFVSSGGARRFTPGDVRLAEELGRRAGAAVHAARLYTERGEIAHELQASMLPGALKDPEGWRVALHHQAAGEANEVGGDLYDVVSVGSGRALVLVGDVVGKGAGAAALTPRIRHTLTASAALTGDPRPGMELLDRVIMDEADGDHAGATAVTVVLAETPGSAGGGVARIVAAGHPAPLLIRAGEVRWVGRQGRMLGLPAAAGERPHEDLELWAGDALVLYTDGVTEAPAAGGGDARFGAERLLEAVRAVVDDGTPEIGLVVEAVRTAIADFSGARPGDDVVVLGVQRTR